jgi:alkylhydroperoxidase family enzyme
MISSLICWSAFACPTAATDQVASYDSNVIPLANSEHGQHDFRQLTGGDRQHHPGELASELLEPTIYEPKLSDDGVKVGITGLKSRVNLVDDANPEANKTFAKLPLVGALHRAMANSPAAFDAFIELSHILRRETTLPIPDRALAIMRVLELAHGDYELHAHRTFHATFDVTSDQVANLALASERSDLYSARQVAMIHFAERFAVSDPAERESLPSDGIEKFLNDRQIVELAMSLGLYLATAHLSGILEIPNEDLSEFENKR